MAMKSKEERETLLRDLDAALLEGARRADACDRWAPALALILERLACPVGTLHLLDAARNVLVLLAHRGLPPEMLQRISLVPVGKGMAGLAAERREPVQVCNLQTDASGVARPAAKAAGSLGSVAVPILSGDGVQGVLGVGKAVEHDFSGAESDLLLQVAARFARYISVPGPQS